MATKGVSRLTSSIDEHKAFHSHAKPLAIVDRQPMTDDEANQFLAAFNKGEMTFKGRLWASLTIQHKAPVYMYTYT